ncbi:hypothetical protein D8674_032088 [Pyrus ussuriensis x Pyrus communis]|uniref:Uncharacterized protein n=1 Tax=Pyrus ussuriensis x Pyrus communis TaxID=2448454 RepID=A0A5N5F0I4_9ROSA|nr:hypothetical protein D8674_032088 [Pyrus ussuriensis x Pyrus communis]
MGFCVPWDPPTWVFTLPRASIPLYTPSLFRLPPSRNPLSLLLYIFLCYLPHHLSTPANLATTQTLHCHPRTLTIFLSFPLSFFLDTVKHISNDGGGAGDLRRGNHQRHLPFLTTDSPLPFSFWKLKLTRQNDKLRRGLTPRRDFPSNPFGCSFNSGDKFPRFPARAMIFRLILRYHRPPNGSEEGRTVAVCGIVMDSAWSTCASTERMTA